MWKMMLVALGLPAVAVAGAPAHVPVQARLLNASGVPLEAPVDVTFSLYAQAAGGSALYTETRTVDPNGGYFSVFVGEVTPIDWSVVDGTSALYVGYSVDGAPELSRQSVGTVPFAAYADRAEQAETADDADRVEGQTVADIVSEVETTYPQLANPYEDTDAIAAVEGAYPGITDPYEDADAVSAVESAHPSITNPYDDTDAVSALESAHPSITDPYDDADAVDAMGALSDSNPLNHDRYTDTEARDTIASEDRYLLDTSDTLSGTLTVTGGVQHPGSPLPAYPWMTRFHRGGSNNIIFYSADGVERELQVPDTTVAVRNEWISYIPDAGGVDSGALYFNINGSSTNACVLLHSEDDAPKLGLHEATDNGNNVRDAWATTSDVRTFIIKTQGGSGLPISVNSGYRIICF